MNRIGIMQGRLSPPVGGRIQAFPWNAWEKEFKEAAAIGFDEIEFIFEAQDCEGNPLFTTEGLDKIKGVSDETGIQVNYVCADYFMERPFFRVSESDRNQSTETLKYLIKQCAKIGIKGIEIPLVDNSKIETEEEVELLTECLKECLAVAETYNVKLGLETSLNPDDFKALLQRINHPLIGANYDTGNSATYPQHATEPSWTRISAIITFPNAKSPNPEEEAAMEMAMKKAAPTSQLILLFASFSGVIVHTILGHSDFLQAGLLSLGSFAGGLVGARLSVDINEKFLRILVSVVIVAAAIKMFFDSLGDTLHLINN